MRKRRTPIPVDVAALVQFESNRTCCVCQTPGRPIQIHHIDGDPSNNDWGNLAVLCTECHDATQIRGGFGRKLDAEQIVLYRDAWIRQVARSRASEAGSGSGGASADVDRRELELATSIAEAYRENGEFHLLAIHYDVIGNEELRDKYIDLLMEGSPSDSDVIYLREMQGRLDLVPPDLIEREVKRWEKSDDLLQRARFYARIGRHQEAVIDYTRGIARTLEDGNVFSAAYYLKELSEAALFEPLFRTALLEAGDEGDLWWQVRALQELEWTTELHDLLIRNADAIEASRDWVLAELLAEARGDLETMVELKKRAAWGTRLVVADGSEAVVYLPQSTEDTDDQT